MVDNGIDHRLHTSYYLGCNQLSCFNFKNGSLTPQLNHNMHKYNQRVCMDVFIEQILMPVYLISVSKRGPRSTANVQSNWSSYFYTRIKSYASRCIAGNPRLQAECPAHLIDFTPKMNYNLFSLLSDENVKCQLVPGKWVKFTHG